MMYDPSLVSQNSQDWHHLNCYACGPANKLSLHADFLFDEATGEVRFTYKTFAEHEGAPDCVHGGVLATLLDESQGVLCFHLGHFVMTDQLSLKYHKASPLQEKLTIRAWLSSVRKRRMYTKGTIHSQSGELLVSSKAKWYVFPEKAIARKFQLSTLRVEHLCKVMEENRKRGKAIRRRLKEA
ncbi:MAG: PaaI family thioesterase [Spirochaetota bacterium]